ncbi:MAG: hypothetical protein QM758_08110 [Armatimonas sp.]
MAKTILLLEPDDTFWRIGILNLERQGYRVLRASSALVMNQILENQTVDVVMKRAPLSNEEESYAHRHKVKIQIIQPWLDFVKEYRERKQ